MELIDREHCCIIDKVFPSNIIAGFTKPSLEGNLPYDAKAALSFLGNDFKVSYLNQLHGNKVNFIEKEGVYDGDGLFSTQNNLCIVIKTADCLPLLSYDIERKTIGALHMGWRGAAAGILDSIKNNLPDIIVAGVGLRQCCYEVSGGSYFDPIGFVKEKISIARLKECGFFDLNICSFCSPDNFYSYRKTKCRSRTLSFIMKLSP